VTHVVSQSDVVKLLWANKTVLGEALAQTVEKLELDDVSGLRTQWGVHGAGLSRDLTSMLS
jgi:hypothetical protein